MRCGCTQWRIQEFCSIVANYVLHEKDFASDVSNTLKRASCYLHCVLENSCFSVFLVLQGSGVSRNFVP